jgi:hypothetical protein
MPLRTMLPETPLASPAWSAYRVQQVNKGTKVFAQGPAAELFLLFQDENANKWNTAILI